MKVFVVACLFLNLLVLPVKADIIYFKDGMKTICQEKAWEEDGQIKCEYAGWVLTYPQNDVLRIVKTNALKNAASRAKSGRENKITLNDKNTQKTSPPSSEENVFYNPRRPYKYWTGKNSKHKTYNEAIKTLATEYGQSLQWIQENMGDSNDLNEIHQNLRSAE